MAGVSRVSRCEVPRAETSSAIAALDSAAVVGWIGGTVEAVSKSVAIEYGNKNNDVTGDKRSAHSPSVQRVRDVFSEPSSARTSDNVVSGTPVCKEEFPEVCVSAPAPLLGKLDDLARAGKITPQDATTIRQTVATIDAALDAAKRRPSRVRATSRPLLRRPRRVSIPSRRLISARTRDIEMAELLSAIRAAAELVALGTTVYHDWQVGGKAPTPEQIAALTRLASQ